jgi:alkyl hydroperoxide reductase subunit AhpC
MNKKTKSLKASKKKPGNLTKKYQVFFSIPKANTPICKSELIELEKLADEFNQRNVEFVIYFSNIKKEANFILSIKWAKKILKNLTHSIYDEHIADAVMLFLNPRVLHAQFKDVPRCCLIARHTTTETKRQFETIHLSVNSNKIGRNPYDILRIIDGDIHGGNCLACTNDNKAKKNESRAKRKK